MVVDLRKRFGSLVRAHRQRQGLTQEVLAEMAGISVDMIAKIEAGTSGPRFRVIEQIAAALVVDPAELFSTDLPQGRLNRGAFTDITAALARLDEKELGWLKKVIDAVIAPKL